MLSQLTTILLKLTKHPFFMKKINFTPELLVTLKKLYKEAVDKNQNSFWFEDHELLTSYAKYLIMYLEGVFSERTKSSN